MTEPRRTRRWQQALDHLSSTLLVAAVIVLGATIAAASLGYRVLVEHSGSMAPAVTTGDLVVTKPARVRELRPGDVVSFSDLTRDGALVTHRVAQIALANDGFHLVTRGDANTGEEKWTAPGAKTVGRMVVRVPRVGYAVAWVARPAVAVPLVGGSALLLAAALAVGARRRPRIL